MSSTATELITELFRRISAREPFDELLTGDVHFEGAFDPVVVTGNVAVSTLFTDVLPELLDPLELHLTSSYVDHDALVAFAEYTSRGTNVVSGADYANTYAGLFHITGDKVDFWREYSNPIPWLDTAGDHLGPLLNRLPDGALVPKTVWKTV